MLSIHLRLGLPSGLFPSGSVIIHSVINYLRTPGLDAFSASVFKKYQTIFKGTGKASLDPDNVLMLMRVL
jgi:hypothetical protein